MDRQDHPMDYSASEDKVLDLSQSKVKQEVVDEPESKQYSTSSTNPHGLTPPYGLPSHLGLLSPHGLSSSHSLPSPHGLPSSYGLPSPHGLPSSHGLPSIHGFSSPRGLPSPHRISPPHGLIPHHGLTPPHGYYPAIPIPLRYPPPPGMGHTNVTDSSDDASDMGSASPPASNAVSSTLRVSNTTRNGRPTRPFKAYPKDLLVGSASSDVLLGPYTSEEFVEFRKKMLSQIQTCSNKSNTNMRRSGSPQQPSSTGEDDARTAAYWERRRKNNEAAKRSRDARRAKEDEIAIRAAFLEQQNMKLKYEVASLRDETAKLRCLMYNR